MGRFITKKILVGLSIIFVFLGCSHSPSFFKEGNHLLWKVSDENSSVWVFGSIHYGDSSFYPLSKTVDEAFKESNALAVEMDISDEETQEETQAEVQQEGNLPNGQTLKDVLPDSLWVKLDSMARSLNFPSEVLLPLRPWMAATVIASVAIISTGIQYELGVDAVMLDSASLMGKEIIALETPKEQIQSLSSAESENEEDGIVYLESTLREFEKMPSMIKGILHAWKTADIPELKKYLTHEEKQTEAEKRLNENVYHKRNIKMAEEISNFLAKDKRVFVVVGVGHLILEDNVLEMLAEKGYTIQKF